MRPVVGFLINIPLRVYKKKALEALVPVIRDRMRNSRGEGGEPALEDVPKRFGRAERSSAHE